MNLHNTWIYTKVCIKGRNIGAHGYLDLYQSMNKILNNNKHLFHYEFA